MAKSVLPATRAKVEKMVDDQYDASFITERYTKAVSTIRNHVNEWWLNHAFVIGHQWLYIAKGTGQLNDMPEDSDRVQATVNRIGRTVGLSSLS